MKIGIIVPQGWTNEYDGWDAADAWTRTRDIAWQAEALDTSELLGLVAMPLAVSANSCLCWRVPLWPWVWLVCSWRVTLTQPKRCLTARMPGPCPE